MVKTEKEERKLDPGSSHETKSFFSNGEDSIFKKELRGSFVGLFVFLLCSPNRQQQSKNRNTQQTGLGTQGHTTTLVGAPRWPDLRRFSLLRQTQPRTR